MSFTYTSTPENALPAKSHASPKTHTPLPRLQERGHRFYAPTLGRWTNRDPLDESSSRRLMRRTLEVGGVKLSIESPTTYTMLQNSTINAVDYLGLTLINQRRRSNCGCDAAAINKQGCAAGKKGYEQGEKTPFPEDALLPGSRKPEFCGRICCNKKTGEVSSTGPVPGIQSKTYAGTVDGKPKYLYGGSNTCNPEKASPPCSEKGADWEDAAYYHSHSSYPDFTDDDQGFTMQTGKPFFMYCNGACSMLDPWVGTWTDGPSSVDPYPFLKQCAIDPKTGSMVCKTLGEGL